MNKRIVCYNYARDRVIINGTTTIAYGSAWANTNNKFGLDASKLIGSIIELSRANWAGKGIAKLSPDDTYDELSGRIVASKKSEKMAIKLALKDLLRVQKNLNAVSEEIQGEIDALLGRLESLKADNH